MKNLVSVFAGLVMCSAMSTSAFAQQGNGGQPDWIEQAKIVAEMDGVSVGEAVRRATLEQRLARQAERLEKMPGYAGTFIERGRNRYVIVHYFSDDTNADILNDSELKSNSRIEKTKFSHGDFKKYFSSIQEVLKHVDDRAYMAFSPQANRMILKTSDPAKLRSALEATGAIPEFVTIEKGGWFMDLNAAMSGGGAISGTSGSCTAGFNVEGSVTGVSTASHCVPYGLQSYQGVAIGTHRGPASTSFPGRDFTWYRNDANTYNNAVLYGGSFYSVTSVASAYPAINTPACLIKQNGTQACAYVFEASIPQGGSYPAVIMDRKVSVAGDSEGAWL